jgi:type I restriction enzyme S subunit
MTMDKKAIDNILLDMRDDHKGLLLDILRANIPHLEVWAFGSRAKWIARETSDLDLVLRNPSHLESPIDLETIGGLKEIFDESDLPFMVDILDWATVSEKFRKVIEREYVVVQEPGKKGWKKYRIGDLGRIVTGKTPPTQNANNFGEKYPFITPKDMLGQKKIDQTERRLSEDGKNLIKNCLLPTNAICVSCIGSDMGKVVMTTEDSITNQQLNSIICSDSFDPNFVYYAIVNISDNLKNVGHHSTAVPILNKTDFSNFKIEIPDLPSQTRIASILSALDDKIELNRQTNATLEAIAQAIFKEWFVDFRFPGTDGEMEESELGLIPKGWRVGCIGDLFELQRGFDLPTSSRIEGIYPVIAASGYNGFHDEYKVKAPGITTGRSGILGNVFYVQEDFWPLNTSLYIKDYKNSTPIFAFYILKKLDLKSLNGGSAVPTLNRNEVHKLEVIIPPKYLLEKFDDLVKPIFENIFSNEQQAQMLTQIRDSLLPKLMNGEIEV